MSVGLAVSSGASGLLLGCLLTGVFVGEEPSSPVSTTSAFLGTMVAETTTGASVAELPRQASVAGEYDLRLLISVVVAALGVQLRLWLRCLGRNAQSTTGACPATGLGRRLSCPGLA